MARTDSHGKQFKESRSILIVIVPRLATLSKKLPYNLCLCC